MRIVDRMICLISLHFQLHIAFPERKKKVPFRMGIGNWALMHECFLKHLRMEASRMKSDIETDEKVRKIDVSTVSSKAGTKIKMSGRLITS